MAEIEELARRFRALHDTQVARAPFSAGLCLVIADHPHLAAILQVAPEEQQAPVLLLAALHDDVLRDPTSELAAWYPTTTATPRTDDVTGAVLRHCDRRREALVATVATRSTQTNEVGRCGLLVPALGLVEPEVGPLALVDVGASAGLNLQLDRYHYRYEPGGEVGVDGSEVELTIGTRGAVPVPPSLPSIVARIGLDRDPIDVADEDDARWLRACVWPDQTDRFLRLDGAIRIARRHPPLIRSADAITGLDAAITDAARHGHPTVLTTWVLSYLADDRRLAFVAELERIGVECDLTWVFAESPAQAAGLPFPPRIEGEHLTALMCVRWRAGRRDVEHLAICHPHGYWLHWNDG